MKTAAAGNRAKPLFYPKARRGTPRPFRKVRPVNTGEMANALAALFAELIDGTPASGGFMLNPGDQGLLRSLDKLSATDASAPTPTGGSIAAHVDHLRYGFALMNRWSKGENPFKDADWGASWRKRAVSDAEWRQLRADLRAEASSWLHALRTPREVGDAEIKGVIGSIAHLAYHLGAIRQMNRAAHGPSESGQTV